MSDDLFFDLSGVRLRLRDVPTGCLPHFRDTWGEFSAPSAPEALLDARIRVAGPPAEGHEINARPLRSRFEGHAAEFAIEEGSARVDRSGSVAITLRPGRDSMQFFTLINLLMPALAWLLPACGGMLVHGAGLIVEDAGLVLVGPAGSGKSTWVALARARGARPLSDDVILLDVRPGPPAVLGAPFRTKDFGSTGPGRWPLAALLLPVHGLVPVLEPVSPMLARARLAANLPYIAERIQAEEPVGSLIEELISAVPVHSLTFAREPSFYSLLEELVRPVG